jgi:hypothetical protein
LSTWSTSVKKAGAAGISAPKGPKTQRHLKGERDE